MAKRKPGRPRIHRTKAAAKAAKRASDASRARLLVALPAAAPTDSGSVIRRLALAHGCTTIAVVERLLAFGGAHLSAAADVAIEAIEAIEAIPEGD